MADKKISAMTEVLTSTDIDMANDLFIFLDASGTPEVKSVAPNVMPFFRRMSSSTVYAIPMMDTAGVAPSNTSIVSEVNGKNLTLESDSAVLGFGADTDVTITHVADLGLVLNTKYITGNTVLGEAVSAANEIEITESSKTFYLDLAAGFATTLPTVATSAGVKYRFVVKSIPTSGDYTIVTDSSDNKIQGTLVAVNGADCTGSVTALSDTITLKYSGTIVAIGDWVELESDGNIWYAHGCSSLAGAITITQAS